MGNEQSRRVRLTIAVAAGATVFLSRYLLASSTIGSGEYDPSTFVLAFRDYDMRALRPHPPGYPLFVELIRFASLATGGPHPAMVLIVSVLAGLAAGFFVDLCEHWFSPTQALTACALLFTAPIIWFYGTVTEIYGFDLLFSILVVWLAERTRRGVLALPVVFALAGGVRPTSPVLLAPLYVFLWWRFVRVHRPSALAIVVAHVVGVIAAVAWFVPTVADTGGLHAYLEIQCSYESRAPGVLRNIAALAGIANSLLIPLVMLLPWLIRRTRQWSCDPTLQLAWLVPPLAFFVFVHNSKGYTLLCLAPLFVMLVDRVRQLRAGRTVVILAAAGQAAFFLWAPHALPSLESYMAPQQRSMSALSIWFDRARSVFIPTRTRIRDTDAAARDLAWLLAHTTGGPHNQPGVAGLQDARSVAHDDPATAGETVFLGPGSPVSIRSLQAAYPAVRWTRLDPIQADGYMVYHQLDIGHETGLATMLAGSHAIARRHFSETRLHQLVDIVAVRGSLALLRIPEDHAAELASLLTSLFTG